MAKRGEWLAGLTPEQRSDIASKGGIARAKKLGKRATMAISRRASGAWSAQQKAKKQALSKS